MDMDVPNSCSEKLNMNFEYSKLESDRFQKKIFKCQTQDIDVKALQKNIIDNEADIVFLRMPSNKSNQIQKLDLLGIPYMQTDTLVYYYSDFTKYEPTELINKDVTFKIIENSEINKKEVERLVRKIFANYTNHYFSNKYLNKSDITKGYIEWVLGYCGENKGRIAWFVEKNGVYIGFATCSFNKEDNISEVVLGGVDSDFSGGGLYGDIIRFTQSYFKSLGISRMRVSTQVQNFAVQKVWAREGFFIKESLATIHINSFLSYSDIKKTFAKLRISHTDIENFGRISGVNPVHFDKESAKKLGFRGTIAHGIIANAFMSKFYGIDNPGYGTLFMSYKYKFLKPLYPEHNYEVEISFPYVKNGIFLSVAKFYDEDKNICIIAYSDLMNRERD